MRKFLRQKANGGPPNVSMDFGAAESKVAKILEAGEYRLRLEAARVIERNQNILIALDLVEVESNQRVDSRPLWVDGPNSNAGNLTAENQHLVARLLSLAKLPTAGNVGELIPKLGGLEFDARLVLAVDSRTQRTFNQIIDVYTDNEANEAS
jgi:hypothetical protein